jgi:ATP-binding cassette subfamily F protein 3
VVFAYMAIQNPHVIIADEISNHLDITTIEALVAALKSFQGSVIIVSHDARFISQVCNELWVCEDGTLKKFVAQGPDTDCGIMEYKKKVVAQSIS